MKSYRDLEVYKESKKLAIEVHKMSLTLPKFELFEEGGQVRRSSKSVTAMIVEGYGKVLGRPQLDLARRELCVVAACAIARQDRQLHSHLHGALHAGASPAQVDAALLAIADLLDSDDVKRYVGLWARVQGK